MTNWNSQLKGTPVCPNQALHRLWTPRKLWDKTSDRRYWRQRVAIGNTDQSQVRSLQNQTSCRNLHKVPQQICIRNRGGVFLNHFLPYFHLFNLRIIYKYMCVLEQATGREERKKSRDFSEPVLSLLLFLLLHDLGQFPTVPTWLQGTGCVFIPSNFYIHSGTISGQIFMASAFIC